MAGQTCHGDFRSEESLQGNPCDSGNSAERVIPESLQPRQTEIPDRDITRGSGGPAKYGKIIPIPGVPPHLWHKHQGGLPAKRAGSTQPSSKKVSPSQSTGPVSPEASNTSASPSKLSPPQALQPPLEGTRTPIAGKVEYGTPFK